MDLLQKQGPETKMSPKSSYCYSLGDLCLRPLFCNWLFVPSGGVPSNWQTSVDIPNLHSTSQWSYVLFYFCNLKRSTTCLDWHSLSKLQRARASCSHLLYSPALQWALEEQRAGDWKLWRQLSGQQCLIIQFSVWSWQGVGADSASDWCCSHLRVIFFT